MFISEEVEIFSGDYLNNPFGSKKDKRIDNWLSILNKLPLIKEVKTPKWIKVDDFNSDSAYNFISKQVSFGPRVPNTINHKKCGDWIVNKLTNYGFKTKEQVGQVTAFNGSKIPVRNIIGNINPNATKKVLLCAHWDTRPFADRDSLNKNRPIIGANDGASGVGVILEIARTGKIALKRSSGVNTEMLKINKYSFDI